MLLVRRVVLGVEIVLEVETALVGTVLEAGKALLVVGKVLLVVGRVLQGILGAEVGTVLEVEVA